MDDITLIEYLRQKGLLKEDPLTESKEMEETHSEEPKHETDIYTEFFDYFKKVTDQMDEYEKEHFIDRLKEYNNKPTNHFTESCAKYTVSKMWHIVDDDKKMMGEYFSMDKAKEVHKEYESVLHPEVTCGDIYVAINAQFHDYSMLFKGWFGKGMPHRIIESALIFWFEDDDAKSTKLWDYFNK